VSTKAFWRDGTRTRPQSQLRPEKYRGYAISSGRELDGRGHVRRSVTRSVVVGRRTGERTMSRWITRGRWDRLSRLNRTITMKVFVIAVLCGFLAPVVAQNPEMQNQIAQQKRRHCTSSLRMGPSPLTRKLNHRAPRRKRPTPLRDTFLTARRHSPSRKLQISSNRPTGILPITHRCLGMEIVGVRTRTGRAKGASARGRIAGLVVMRG